ncbi:MAG: hypothetical protein ACI835_005825 [Planctomycetota bacterium]|jgi:hypothetical protein
MNCHQEFSAIRSSRGADSPHSLLSTLTAAILLTSIASATPFDQPDGVCTPAEEAVARCFETSTGFTVEIIPGVSDEFPVINADGNSVFAYRITGPGANGGSCAGVSDVSHSDIAIPVCLENPIVILDSEPGGRLLSGGQGDPSCGFGAGDLDRDVFKWDVGAPCSGYAEFSFVVAGVRQAAPTGFLLKEGNECRTGEILGPDCGSTIDRFCEGTNNCPCGNEITDSAGCANSTGEGGIVGAAGSSSVFADDLTLTATGLPANQFALFIAAEGTHQLPFGDGFLCVGGPGIKIIRYNPVQNTGLEGQVTIGPGLVALSYSGTLGFPSVAGIDAGETWFWQAWYRDATGPCGAAYNLTSALAVSYVP